MGKELTVSVEFGINTNDDTRPYEKSAITTPTGGGWAVDTYSFRVVAIYGPSDTTDKDLMGVNRLGGGEGLWEGVGVVAGDKVVIDWNAAARAPNFYRVYYQVGANWLTSQVATEAAEVNGNTTTVTIDSPSDASTVTFGIYPTSLVINPVLDLTGLMRDRSGRGYNGKLFTKSYAVDTLIDRLRMRIVPLSLGSTDWDLLLKFVFYGVQIKIAESGDSFISDFIGQFIDSDYLNSKGKNTNPYFLLEFLVESEVLA